MTDSDPLQDSVYQELRRIAERNLSAESPDNTLSPTALVHEAWLRLAEASVIGNDRHHYYCLAATAMRRILVDRARSRLADKRGGNFSRHMLYDTAAPVPDNDLLNLHEALSRLAEVKPQHAHLVELRFFGGLTGDEAATALGISPASADRLWRYARSWLQLAMTDDPV